MLKLVSVNIEGDKHLDKIINLINKENPEVICMQEVFEDDVELFKSHIGGSYLFSPMLYKPKDNPENNRTDYFNFGTLIISKLPVIDETQDYYYKDKDNLRIYVEEQNAFLGMVLGTFEVEKDGDRYRIGTTHFCKSAAGEADDFQRSQIPNLMNSLDKFDEIIFCGDFNAPRGMEIFSTIESKYKDNIDPIYETSLDPELHRAGFLPYVVDGLFSSPEYKVHNMYFQDGVSDHYAIVSEIEKLS